VVGYPRRRGDGSDLDRAGECGPARLLPVLEDLNDVAGAVHAVIGAVYGVLLAFIVVVVRAAYGGGDESRAGRECLGRPLPGHPAAERAAAAGLDVVMDRCVKMEHGRFNGTLHWGGMNTEIISARKARLPTRR
jgi:hypothetical protein